MAERGFKEFAKRECFLSEESVVFALFSDCFELTNRKRKLMEKVYEKHLAPRSDEFSRGILVYGLPIWGKTFETYRSKLQTLQNKAMRIITNSDLRTPITPKYRNLRILKITELYTFEITKLMHQHSKNSLLSSFSIFFTSLSDIHERQTKSKTKSNFYLPKFSTRRCQRSLKYHGVKIWNLLSPKLRNQSFKSFKMTMKNDLLDNYQ